MNWSKKLECYIGLYWKGLQGKKQSRLLGPIVSYEENEMLQQIRLTEINLRKLLSSCGYCSADGALTTKSKFKMLASPSPLGTPSGRLS
jgi:hypothetical protein